MSKIALSNNASGTGTLTITAPKDNAFILFDPDNTDCQEYFRWLSESNEPLPADE